MTHKKGKTGTVLAGTALALVFTALLAPPLTAQTSNTSTPSTTTQAAATNTSGASTSDARARRRAARRRQRALAAQQSSQTRQPASTQVGPPADQRARDAKILEAQKAQSARIAQENDEATQLVVRERQQQQAEPRIQDAPGPGSEPLPGEPAVQPSQPADPPRIQDAPGPAQTLPKAPPPAPAPQMEKRSFK